MYPLKLYACMFLVLMTSGAGVGRSHPPVVTSVVYQASQDEETKVASNATNSFGLPLLADLASRQRQRNVFISPLSLFAGLTMTENGAAGKTRDAIRRVLTVPTHVSEDALHESASALLKSLRAQKSVELSIANALWSDTQWPLAPAFVDQCRKLYEADATTLDFSQPAAADSINRWVSEKTQGKIPGIVTPEIVAAPKAILTNAVYFKGRWYYQFDESQTKAGTFHLANGKSKQVDLMHRSWIDDGYRSGDGFEAAALPYENSTIRLYAVLPAPGKKPEEVLKKISVEKLRDPTEHTDLELRLPKFTLDFQVALKDVLENLGMAVAFKPGADFTAMGPPQFYLGDVLHKTRLEIDEVGTVAAATTVVIAKATATMQKPAKKKTLVFDRPFALLICDTETGAILFAGVVYDP